MIHFFKLAFILLLIPQFSYAQRVIFQKWERKNSSTTTTETTPLVIGQDALIWSQPSGEFLIYTSVNDSTQQRIAYHLFQYNPTLATHRLLKTYDRPIDKIKGAATWQDNANNILFFGGTDGSVFLQNESCWKLNKDTFDWEVEASERSPSVRNHAMVWENSRHVWLFGGSKMDSVTALPVFYSDLWQWDKESQLWQELSVSESPTARSQSIVWMDSTHQHLYLYGGLGKSSTTRSVVGLDDLWRFNIERTTWELVQGSRGDYSPKRTIFDNNRIRQQTGEAPTTEDIGYRIGAKSWQQRSGEVWVWGGQRNKQQEDPLLWLYSITTNEWKSVIGHQYPTVEYFDKVLQPSANEVFILGKKQPITTNLSEVYTIQITQKR